jgi:hypothetical protein
MKDKIEFIAKDNILNFISKLSDITKISDSVRLKIDKDNILMYGMVGDTAILAFKSHLLKTEDYFEFKDFDFELDYVLVGAKKFVKNLNFFEYKEKTKFSLSFKDNPDNENIKNVKIIVVQDSLLKISTIGDMPNKIREISKKALEAKFDPSLSNFAFTINQSALERIRKISSNSDEKIITASIKSHEVYFSEGSKWSLNVGNTDSDESIEINFDNSYLSNINTNLGEIKFYVFDTTILFKEDINSNLLISFEQLA